jgi:hypothetical protein
VQTVPSSQRRAVRARLAELLREPLELLANETPLRKLSRYNLRSARVFLNELGLDLPDDQLRRLETVQHLLEAVESAPRLARIGSPVAGREPGDSPPTVVPPAPAGTYEPAIPYQAERIRAVALHCGDGRLGLQVDGLLHDSLGLPRYDRLACPGGPVALAGRLLAHWECRGVEDQLRFLVRTHELAKVVLVAHEDCGYYRDRLRLSPAECEVEQRKDLEAAASSVLRIAEDLEVLAFFARRVGDRVRFEPVATRR